MRCAKTRPNTKGIENAKRIENYGAKKSFLNSGICGTARRNYCAFHSNSDHTSSDGLLFCVPIVPTSRFSDKAACSRAGCKRPGKGKDGPLRVLAGTDTNGKLDKSLSYQIVCEDCGRGEVAARRKARKEARKKKRQTEESEKLDKAIKERASAVGGLTGKEAKGGGAEGRKWQKVGDDWDGFTETQRDRIGSASSTASKRRAEDGTEKDEQERDGKRRKVVNKELDEDDDLLEGC